MTENGVECVAENKDWKREKKECVCLTEGHVSIERGRERERENEPMLSTPLIFFTLATTNFSLSVSKRNKKNEKNVARSNQLGPERGERECVWARECVIKKLREYERESSIVATCEFLPLFCVTWCWFAKREVCKLIDVRRYLPQPGKKLASQTEKEDTILNFMETLRCNRRNNQCRSR